MRYFKHDIIITKTLRHNVYTNTVFYIVLDYLQLNKTSLSCSRSDNNILQFFEQLLFVFCFDLHSSTLLPPLPIELTFDRCFWYSRSSFFGFITISSDFFCFWYLQSEAFFASATTNVEVEPVGKDLPRS